MSLPPSTLDPRPSTLACGYVRGSTEDQVGTLTAQSDQIAAYCAFKKFTLIHPSSTSPDQPSTLNPQPAACFIDSGTSAFSTPFYQRPVAAGMVALMLAAGVRHLVITKLDRGFRNTLDCLTTLADLAAKGIAVHVLDLQLDTSTSVGNFVLTVMAAMAQLENERRSERQKDVFKVRRAQSLRCGKVPYGKRLDPTNPRGKMLDDEYEQQTLARLLPGGDLATLPGNAAARQLNTEGKPAKHGGKWHGPTVNQLRKSHLRDKPNPHSP